jgi:hypothetical protein
VFDYHGVAVGGEGLKFGQSPRLLPFVFSASAPKGGGSPMHWNLRQQIRGIEIKPYAFCGREFVL